MFGTFQWLQKTAKLPQSITIQYLLKLLLSIGNTSYVLEKIILCCYRIWLSGFQYLVYLYRLQTHVNQRSNCIRMCLITKHNSMQRYNISISRFVYNIGQAQRVVSTQPHINRNFNLLRSLPGIFHVVYNKYAFIVSRANM